MVISPTTRVASRSFPALLGRAKAMTDRPCDFKAVSCQYLNFISIVSSLFLSIDLRVVICSFVCSLGNYFCGSLEVIFDNKQADTDTCLDMVTQVKRADIRLATLARIYAARLPGSHNGSTISQYRADLCACASHAEIPPLFTAGEANAADLSARSRDDLVSPSECTL